MKKNYLLTVDSFLNTGKKIILKGLRPLNAHSDNKLKNTFFGMQFRVIAAILSFLFFGLHSYAQNLVPFGVRYNTSLKGDMLLIGNNILSKHKSDNYNDLTGNTSATNNNINMVNVDIDTDNSTTNSSSANLTVPSTAACYKIKYAGLYWGAVEKGNSAIANIKFKLPGATEVYRNLTGAVIYNQNASASDNNSSNTYVCYLDVTTLLTGLTNPQGTYTVANVSTAVNNNNDINVEGLSAGWSLIVIYEDPTLPTKNITTFDGFSRISGGNNQTITVSGFKTIPSGEVKAKYAFSAFEGDRGRTADFLQINGKTPTISATDSGGTVIRPANDFFNSSISDINPTNNTPRSYIDRSPASLNTLGFDAGILNIPNGNGLNTVIGNGDTSATITLGTANNNSGDIYYFYFNAFAVEVIEPKIELVKRVENSAGTDIGNTNVQPQDVLNYVISFRNKGNDDATSLTIRDVLPVNTVFNYPADLGTLPTGVTVKSYNAATREIVFNIANSIVKIGSGYTTIRLKVKVSDCDKLADACSNTIDNQAFATYKGSQNTSFIITDDPSLDTFAGCLTVPKATNFLVGVENCQFEKAAVLCGTSVTLKAADGYNAYSWSTSPTGTPVIGTGQSISVSALGTYYSKNTAAAPCISIIEKFTVTGYSVTSPNPVIPFASQTLKCTNDGKLLPVIFLCGTNDSRNIQTGISDGSTIVWEKLNENVTCPAATNATLCANESDSCSWSQVGTGPDYIANSPGQYRITLTYAGGVCFNRFYFNVFQNNFTPTVTSKDILCTPSGNPKGSITVTNPVAGSGYEYSLYVRSGGAFIPATAGGAAIGNASSTPIYQASNVFTIDNPGLYAVYVKQTSVTNPCIFKVEDIQILKVDLNKTYDPLVTHPKCFGDKGSIRIYATAHTGTQYTYELFKNPGNVSVNKVGPIVDSDYTFTGLDSGDYTFTVKTDDGCGYTNYYTHINDPAGEMKAVASIKTALTPCRDGVIKVSTTQAGNFNSPPFAYFVNGSATPINSLWDGTIEIPVTTSGLYTIRVVGANVCETTVTQQIDLLPKPVYTVAAPPSVNCYNDNASITVNVSNANGYSLEYSKDNGLSFQTSNVFSNLTAGTYNIVIRYGMASDPKTSWCTDTAQNFVITGPTDALTASSGVAELAGCTLPDGSGVNQGGKIRITNAQGGTAPYQYSFDGGLTYGSLAEADKLPGTYTLYVKDFNGCIFAMPAITLDAKLQDPVIDNNVNPVYNCNGTATATVVVNTPATTGATYTYEYYLQTGAAAPVPNVPLSNNVFTNVPSGNHNVIIKYNIQSVSTFSNLLQEDFGKGGYTTTPGINPAYCFEDETSTHLDPAYKCNKDEWINDGEYAVASSIRTTFGVWLTAKDHTVPADPLGRFLCVNVGGSAGIGGILYSKPIKDVIPNQPVIISLWAENLIRSGNTHDDPKLTIQLVNNLNGVGGPETIVATTDTSNPWVVPKSDKWEQLQLSLNPGNYNNLSFVVRSYSNEFHGNDVLLDDIWVRQIPKSCINQKEFPIVIDSNKAFTASVTGYTDLTCAGSNDGTITIAAQNFAPAGFYYSIDGNPFVLRTTSPLTITGLSAGSHSVRVQYDLSASPCLFTLPQTITAPSAVTVTASVTTPATCTTGASITAVGNGGTPAYQYELRQSNGTTVIPGFSFSANAVFTNVPAGSYTVFAKDANSCISAVGAPVTVTAPPSLTASIAASSDLCYDTVNQASLVVTASGGKAPFSYSLDNAASQTSNTFTNVGSGTHSILVTDSNNCTYTISNITIAPQLTLTAALAQDLTCLVNASITSTVNGGYGGPYTYTGTRNGTALSPAPTFPFTATQAGTYVFTVTDSKGCTATSNTITVTPKTTPTLTFSKTDITCNNANDGTITITPANGFTSTYTYAYKLSSAASYSSTPNPITGLAAGTYNIKVIDSKGCESAVTNVTINNPATVSGTIGATELGCSATGTVPATVTVTGTGGTAPYQYSFNGTSNFTTANTFSTSTAGTITAYVKDVNGCQFGPLSVVISPKTTITGINVMFDTGLECPAYEAHVKFQAIGGSSPIRYQIIAGPAGFSSAIVSDGEFKNLKPGDYIFRATDKNGCSFDLNYTIKNVPDITAGGNVITPIKCFGDKGTIQFTVTGVKDNGYNYVIKNAANVTIQSANNVSETTTTISVPAAQPAGAYTITATDRKTGCTASYTVTLTQPAAALSITSAVPTHVNCNNDNSQITVTVTGGTPNYSYAAVISGAAAPLASAYGSSNIITVDTNSSANLAWDVYVKDANDCSFKTAAPVTIISDPTPSVTAVVSNQCSGSGSNFTITATGSGGTGTLTYGINGTAGAFQAGNTFSVAPGTYTVWVKDGNLCTASAAPITVSPQLTVASAVTKTLDCSASPDAVITTTIIGGKAPYTYTVKKGSGTPSGSISIPSPALTFTYPVSNANADTYTFVITDANTCTFTTTATVSPITNPTVTPTPTQVSCNGGTNGAVSLTAAGGSGGYTYSFNGSPFSAATNYTGLSAGIAYPYQVKDSNGCVSVPATITLTEPTALVVSASATNFSCSAANTKQAAVVTINVPTTGTAPYTYSFNGGGYTSTRTLTVNDNGTDQTISYSVKDFNGCIQAGTAITINRLNPPTISGISGTPIYCAPVSSTTSTVTVTAANGVGTLAYTITAGPVINTSGASTGIFTGLTAGTYTFRVTDANGCYAVSSHTVPPVTPITAIATKLTDVDCFGNSTGSIHYDLGGFTTYSYTINAGTPVTAQTAASFNLLNRPAGVYNVVFTDEITGCTASTSITITQPAAALTAGYTTVNANCFVAASKVTVTPSGGTPAYSYSFVADGAPAGTYVASNIADLDPALVWDVWVKDAKGCTFKLDLVIAKDPVPTVTASAVGQCLGVGSYTITANGTGGVAPLTYSINAGASYQAGNTFVVTTAGSYTIRVKDANGCTADSNVIIVAPQLTLSAVLNKDITCSAMPITAAQITLTKTGGSAGPFTYTASPNTGSFAGNVFTTSTAGNYTFTVTDTATGCTYSTTTAITVTVPVNPDITGVTQTQTIKCNGDDTAAIAITIDNTKGQSPFVFDVLNTTTGTNYGTQTSGLAAGNYTITVTDAKGCTDTQNIVIAEPTPITFTRSITPITCNSTTGVSLGSITINSVSGGSPNYTYHVTGVNGYDIKFNNQTGLSAVFDVVDFGLYQIIITDANGCTAFENDILIASPPDDLDISITAPPADCSVLGSAVLAVGGTSSSVTGPGPYHFAVYSPGLTYTGPTALPWYDEDAVGSKKTTIPNLLPGVTYTFIVHDGTTGCYYFETSTIAIPTSSTMTVNPLTANNITCKGNADGSVTFTMNHTYGVPTPVTYQVYNAQSVTPVGASVAAIIPAGGSLSVSNFGVLPFGNYFVLVTETAGAAHSGCSVTSAPFNITESAIDLSVAASVTKNVNCNPNSGIISAAAKDGTAPYTYQYLLASDPIPTASTAGWTSNTTFSTSITGNYIVYAKDAYGCIKQTAVVPLDADDAPVVIPPASPICYDGSTPFTITFSGTVDPDIVGAASYSVNGSAFQASPSFTFNAAGTYNLVVKDGNGCTADVDYIVHPKLNLSASLTKELDCTVSPDAVITLTAAGGDTTPAANYTYEYSTTGGAPWTAMGSNVLSVAASGTYTFRVTDANVLPFVCQTTEVFVLDPIPATVFTTTETNVSCNLGTDGTITVNVTGGVGPYTYDLTGTGANNTGDATGIYTGLPAGTAYVVTVRNAKNCTQASVPITITEPTPLTATTSVTTPLTCGTGNVPQKAVVTVTGSGGTGAYEYSFDGVNYSSQNTYETYSSVTVIGYVRDANSCVANDSKTINTLNPPTNMTITGTPVWCSPAANTTSTVTINSVTNGVGLLTYTILPSIPVGVTQTGNQFAGLTPGTYVFQVTDANGCTYQESYTIDPVNNITVNVQSSSDVTCNETPAVTNGAVTFAVNNVNTAGAFTYTMLQGSGGTIVQSANAVTLTNLGIGTYEIEVTDTTTGCKSTATAVVSQPAAPLSLSEVIASRVNANCNSDAKVEVAATGGTPNYTYAFVADGVTPAAADYTANTSAVLPFTGTMPNNWDVWVKDNNGCTFKLDIVTNKDALPSIVLPAAQCFAGAPLAIDLSLPAVTTVPVGPVKYYTINGSNQTSPNYTITAPGTYQLSVTDANGCVSNTVNYVVQPQLILNASLTQDLTCTVNASIALTVTGGTGTYNAFEVSYNGGLFGPASNPYTALTDGDYVFRVSDNQVPSCPAVSSTVTVTPKTTPTASFTQTNVSCINGTDGTITITAANGIAPYQYSIDNGGTYQLSNVFKNLTDAGVYNIIVKDAKNCLSVAVPVDITQPLAVSAGHTVTPFGCNTSNVPQDAVVTITPSGGAGSTPLDYTYSFDGGNTFQASPSFSVSTQQTINYVVRDANGCSYSDSVPVAPFTPPTDMNLSASPIYCNTVSGQATVTVNSVTGGAGLYTFEIISPASAITAPSALSTAPFSFANLAPDTYVIKVTDANGCSTTKAIIVEEAPKIDVTAELKSNVLCNGGNTGAVNFTVSNYIDPAIKYTFGLVPAGTFTQAGDIISYTGLAAGNYTFTVTDGVSGCTDSVVNFTISEPAVALSSSSIAANINCNNDTAVVTITAHDGTAPYKYAVAKASDPVPTAFVTGNQFVVDTNNGADMNWTAYVIDANGCVANNAQPILIDANPVIASAVSTQCPNPLNGTYDITVTASGTGTLVYSIDGSNFQAGNILTVNAPGNYTVWVKDANGCISVPAAAQPIVQPLTLTASISKVPTCNDADGEVTLTAGGGSSAYVYSRDGVTYVPGNVFTGLAPNAVPYQFYVRDTGTNCVKNINFTIEPATVITGFVLTPAPVSCNGASDGTITAVITAPAAGVNDNPVYTYEITAGPVLKPAQTSNVFAGLPTGLYTVRVVSGRGCEAVLSTTVDTPAVITVPAPVTAEFGCNSGSNAVNFATITVTGVTGGSNIYNRYEFIKVGTPNKQVQSGTSNVYTESDTAGGSYIINVYDSKGCLGTAAASINPYIALDKINVAVNNAITCNNAEEITVTAATAGGTPASLQYTVEDIAGGVYGGKYNVTNTTGVFSGADALPIGDYRITVLNTTTGCSIQTIHYVTNPNTFDLVIDKVVDVCYGQSTGTADVTIVDRVITATNLNNAGPFTYTIADGLGNTVISGSGTSPNAGPFTLTGLKADVYTITASLTNAPFCSVSKIFTIAGPTADLIAAETHTAITCALNDGTITASASGGWQGGYEYELAGPVSFAYSANPAFTGLTAGAYTVNVRDSNGCIDSLPVTLNNPTPIGVTVGPNILLSCQGDTSGVITAAASGGQGSNYLYTLNVTSASPVINSGPQISGTFTGLGIGTYTITATDGWGCSITSTPVTITEPSKVIVDLKLQTAKTCNNTAQVILTASGGTAPYTYSTDGLTYTAVPFAGNVVIDVPVGYYQYYVKDNNGCRSFISNGVDVVAPAPLTFINVQATNAVISCFGNATGVIDAIANGGLGNYSYTLFNNGGTAVQGPKSDGNFTGLIAGTYTVRVDSGDCNITSSVVTITQPAAILDAVLTPTPITCNGIKNGKIVVAASGGAGSYIFAISSIANPRSDQFFNTNIFEDLAPGTYEIVIQDKNGCYITRTATIIEPPVITAMVDPASVIPQMCADVVDGQLEVTMDGGIEPYQVRIDGGAYQQGVLGQKVFLFQNLRGGSHTIDYKDANSCSNGFDYALPDAVKLDPQVAVDYGCDNNSPSLTVTVSIDPSVTNHTAVDYALDGVNYQASNVFTSVPPGVHYIMARYSDVVNGFTIVCEKPTPNFSIAKLDPLTLILTNGGLNEIVATVKGGAGGYQYIFDGVDMGSQNKFIYYKSGTYVVKVTDANGCYTEQPITVKFIDIEIPNVFTPNGDGDNDGWAPLKTHNYPDLVFHIFDRYGRKVGSYREGQFWDGKYEGQELPTGDYWFVIKLQNEQDSREFVGHFTLYR